MKIHEVIVVEGEHDATRLKELFDVETIITNGSAISKETLSLIQQVNNKRGVIVFCDPDYPGEQIRKKIMAVVPHAMHAFLRKEDAIDQQKNKVGIEHASDEALIKALEYVVTFDLADNTLSWNEYLEFPFIGNKEARKDICEQLNIGYCNAKTLFKRLNMLSLSYHDIVNLLGDNDE
ncbi:ribonuclease M5 [Erysipelotrichaceae bacterium OttesenSCG-928-M19]|nr:ribonuclease M5 [Erysipelotrichaceae bacterium OttesenSCG-928-M19]